MDDKIKNKISTLVESMCKSAKKISEKDIISDIMDSDRVAEINPDDIPKARAGALSKAKNKAKKKAKELDMDKCADVDDCDCGGPVEKGEKFVKDFMEGFEKISKAYLMEKAKIDTFEPSATKRRANRAARGKTQNIKTAKDRKQMRSEDGTPLEEFKGKAGQAELKDKLKNKKIKSNNDKGILNIPSKEDLEYPMASSEDC